MRDKQTTTNTEDRATQPIWQMEAEFRNLKVPKESVCRLKLLMDYKVKCCLHYSSSSPIVNATGYVKQQ